MATVGRRQFSRGGGLCRDSEASSEGSLARHFLSETSVAHHPEEDNWDEELSIPGSADSTVVNGAAMADQVKISARVRKAMRSVPQPVSIITSTDITTGKPVFRGATISSFSTVTIEPTTIVSLNIKRPSSTFDAIESSGYFLVHLLSANQTNSELAQAFTKGSSFDPFQTLVDVSQIRLPQVSGQVAAGNAAPPLISCRSPGHLLCRYLPPKTVQVGDHVVIFGTVDMVTKKRTLLEGPETTCLVYANGRYGHVSPLGLSSALKISRAAFDDFVHKIRLMDHTCLHASIHYDIYLDRLGPELKASLGALRYRGKELFNILTRDDNFNSGSRSLRNGFGTLSVSSLGSGILEAVTFYAIFLAVRLPTRSSTFETTHLPLEAIEALQRYQIVMRRTNDELLAIKALLQRLRDPQTNYQPIVSGVYSLKKVPPVDFGEKFRYLENYVRCCLSPLTVPETIFAPMPVLQSLLTQANAALRETLQWISYQTIYHQAHRSGNALSSQPNPARAQARTAITRIHQKDVLLSWAERPAKKLQRLQNISEDFQGLDDGFMLWLRQYGENCERTAAYLNSYKAFLRASELYSYQRDELGRSEEDGPVRTVLNTVPRKWFGRDVIKPRVYTTKPPPLVRQYMRNDGTGATRRVPGPLVVRAAVVGPSPNEAAEEEVRLRFMDPLARRIDFAERQEQSIQRGLKDIERLMGAELSQRSTGKCIDAPGAARGQCS